MSKNVYLGLFLVSLATLMYELLLTRIWSVTMWYHFAFVAISVTMFGLTAGAIVVYLFPAFFSQERASQQLGESALAFAAAMILCFLTLLCIPFVPSRSFLGLYLAALIYTVAAIPFFFSGICITLALTKFSPHVGKLYAADLSGAAAGCILLVYLMKLTDGPTAVFATALLAGLGAWSFLSGTVSRKLRGVAVVLAAGLAVYVLANTWLLHEQRPLLRLLWVKGSQESPPLYDKWNAFSRVTVTGLPEVPETPFGWAFSPTYKPVEKVRQLQLSMDGIVQTMLTAFSGDLSDVEYMKYDVTNIAYYLVPHPDVFIVGAGGGRDVLSALLFGAKSVVGAEMNEDIIDTVNRRFGDFTGHLDRDPRVLIVADEARSYVASKQRKFDIIQLSVINTCAVTTAAGALALTEHSLYTVEAWKVFLEHLTDNGLITCSRFYSARDPGEVLRLVSMARQALVELGVNNPQAHIAVVDCQAPMETGGREIATVLVSRRPLTSDQLDTLQKVASEMHFQILQSPRGSANESLRIVASGIGFDDLAGNFPLRLDAPRDNSPFFFFMLPTRSLFSGGAALTRAVGGSYLKAQTLLAELFVAVVFLTLVAIAFPLLTSRARTQVAGNAWLFSYFAFIGLGFMFIEISQLERLIVFLGHPTFSLSVVLFALLLGGGLGSYTTVAVKDTHLPRSLSFCLACLLLAFAVYGSITPMLIGALAGADVAVRVAAAAAMLLPLGMFMGMAFPLGMRLATTGGASLAPWLWGVNGATSVCGSVASIAVAVTAGISASFWVGVSCYVAALVAVMLGPRLGGRMSVESDPRAEQEPASGQPEPPGTSTS